MTGPTPWSPTPGHATAVLAGRTSLPAADVDRVFGAVFSHGMQAAMWLLTAVSAPAGQSA